MTSLSKNQGKRALVPNFHKEIILGFAVSGGSSLRQIMQGEQTLWRGDIRESQIINVNRPDFWGGPKFEGGVGGAITIMFGDDHQLLPEFIKRKMFANREPDAPTEPTASFRNMITLFFHEFVLDQYASTPTRVRPLADVVESAHAQYVKNPNYSMFNLRAWNTPVVGFHFAQGSPQFKDIKIRMERCESPDSPFGRIIRPRDELAEQDALSREQKRLAIAWARLTAAQARAKTVYEGDQTEVEQVRVVVGNRQESVKQAAQIADNKLFENGHPVKSILSAQHPIYDDNPAYIILDIMTNPDTGAGLSPAHLDIESFEIAARQLYDEGFGLTIAFTASIGAAEMVSEVLDHINGICYPDSRSGLITLRLFREGDYDTTDPVFYQAGRPILGTDPPVLGTGEYHANPDNSEVMKFQRKRENLANEIVVSYTNPITGEEDSLTVQDNSAISAESGRISDSRNFYGIWSATFARELGERELRAVSAPLATMTIKLFPQFWHINPGDILAVESPEDQSEVLFMRVMSIEEPLDGLDTILAQLSEDIFSLSQPFVANQSRSAFFENTALPLGDPANLGVKIITLPYLFANREGLYRDRPTIGHIATLVNTTQESTYRWQLHSVLKTLLDNTILPEIQTGEMTAKGELPVALGLEDVSTIPLITNLSNGPAPQVDSFLLVGASDFISYDENKNPMINLKSNDDAESELMGIKSIDEVLDSSGNGTGEYTMTLWRGALDTVIREHRASANVWVLTREGEFHDSTDRLVDLEPEIDPDDPARFIILPGNNAGFQVFNPDYIPASPAITADDPYPDSLFLEQDIWPRSYYVSNREHLPYRPANVRVQRRDINTGNVIAEPALTPRIFRQATESVIITWANRSRLFDSRIHRWSEGNVMGEPGQKTKIELLRRPTEVYPKLANETLDSRGLVVLWGSESVGEIAADVKVSPQLSQTIPNTAFGSHLDSFIRVSSVMRTDDERDGLTSLQHTDIQVLSDGIFGWGESWGLGWSPAPQ